MAEAAAAPAAVQSDAADGESLADEHDEDEDDAATPTDQDTDASDAPPYFEDLPDEAYADDAVPTAQGAAEDASLINLPVQAHQVSHFDRPANTFGESLGRVPAEFVDTEDGRFWNDAVTRLIDAEAVQAVARQLALRSQLVKKEQDCWWLQVDLESLAAPGTVERLRTALVAAGMVGKIAVSVGPVDDCPARRKAHATQARQRQAEDVVRNDPYVQSLVQQFGAKIVPGSIQPL